MNALQYYLYVFCEGWYYVAKNRHLKDLYLIILFNLTLR